MSTAQPQQGLVFCSRCKIAKPRSAYYAHRSRYTGIQAECKACVKERNREAQYRKYGLSIKDYERMVEERSSKCDICATYYEPLEVDHDHATLLVRGLLCPMCNKALGLLRDDVRIMRNAIKYIDTHNNT